MHVIPGPDLFHQSTPTQISHVLVSANNIIKKKISSISELLSNNSLFGGQLLRSLKSRARVIYLHTTNRQTVNYYSTIHKHNLIYFNSNIQ